MKRLRIVLAGLAVVALVFWLKVEHAIGLCAEAGGRWDGIDCLFEDPNEPPEAHVGRALPATAASAASRAPSR